MDLNQSPQNIYYDYLYTINPIAERIRKDVDAAKDSYQYLWLELTLDEQNKILEESIISPEAVLKYSKYKKPDKKISEGGFSWFTRSQLDLCKHIDSVRENFSANECKATVVKQIVTKESQDNKLMSKIKSNALFKSLMPTEDKNKAVKSDRTKPKCPPPPPPPLSPQVINPKQTIQDSTYNFLNNDNDDDDDDNDGDDNHDNHNIETCPKTGFDFLVNW
ncbi:uncharacterized protein LOC112593158 [Melanaphis sacchari]|uniref:uncharacterized protein LOC112593158 n=1 Tax=Melanaphis sacchari TaxID=742174 RepID=UPI000DC150B5|nr:uncharacterized protein LOC112593158 [Melanaphis sacchari]